MIKYYYPIVDAMMYLASVVNEESAKALVADLEANKPDILAEATKILRPALDLEAELEKTLHLDGLNYDFYFQHDMHSRDLATSTSSAAFILLANLKECITETSGLDDVLALRHNLTRRERMSLFSSNEECTYRSSVIVTEACPNISDNDLISKPTSTARVANV